MQANAPIRSRPPDRSVRVEARTADRQISEKDPASHTPSQTDHPRLDPHIEP